jgi:hypothetical protein
MTPSSNVLPLRRTKLSSQSELRSVVSLNCLRTNFSDEYQVKDMPSKPVRHIAPRSLTNVNNKQNKGTSGFSPCHSTTNSLHWGSNRQHHSLQGYKRKALCLSHIEQSRDTMAMRWRYGWYDTIRALHTGGDPPRKYTLLHTNTSTDEEDMLFIWWVRRLKKKALRSTEVEWADLL